MTSANNFTIDGALAPVDANTSFEKLKEWLATDGQGRLEIAPLPEPPELPTQPALQLLFVAVAKLAGNGDVADRLNPDALALCHRLLGDDALTKLCSQEAENG